jgi:hypothetical protein
MTQQGPVPTPPIKGLREQGAEMTSRYVAFLGATESGADVNDFPVHVEAELKLPCATCGHVEGVPPPACPNCGFGAVCACYGCALKRNNETLARNERTIQYLQNTLLALAKIEIKG